MKDKKTVIIGLGGAGEKAISSLIKNIEKDIPLSDKVLFHLVKDSMEGLGSFNRHYDNCYRTLEVRSLKLIDVGASTTEFRQGGSEWLKKMDEQLEAAKRRVVKPAYEILGDGLLKTELYATDIVALMRKKQATDEQFHQIVSGLARWQVLEELRKKLTPTDFAPCFAGLVETPGLGRPTENIYDHVDTARLRETLEALHREKYRVGVEEGWCLSKERTRHFLLAFMLSLFKKPLVVLGGKMAAFARFFADVCGYTFAGVKNLQNWFKAYLQFDVERYARHANAPVNEPQKDYDKWMRRWRKYTSIEALAGWMQGLLPNYGVAVV